MDRDAAGTYETQFVSQSDDDDNLYNVEKILDERGKKYLVQWEGNDPVTGKKWPADWVLKTDCTDDLIAEWKREKEYRKRRATSSKRSSSASGSVTSRPPIAKAGSTLKQTKNKRTSASASSPVSEARSISSVNTAASKPAKQKSRFVIQLPARTGTKRPREPDATSSVMSPVKRLRLNGPASPLPASPFDNDDGGIEGKKRAGPITYKKRKPAVGKSPLSKKSLGPLAAKTSKISASNEASSSRAKPLRLPSTQADSGKGATKTAQRDKENSATEDEDSDPQLPERRKPIPSKAPIPIGPKTRSRQSLKSSSMGQEDPPHIDPATFVRPHPTTCARTRLLPPQNPAANRANLRAVNQNTNDTIPAHVWKSLGARNKFPKVVTGGREKQLSTKSGNSKDRSNEAIDADDAMIGGGKDVEVEEQPKPLSPERSQSGSSIKPASLRGDGGEAGDRNNLGGGEQVMSSVESENAPALTQEEVSNPPPFINTVSVPAREGLQAQTQSQGNSSKGTVVPDSQVPSRKTDASTQESAPADPPLPVSPSPSPPRSSRALAKSGSIGSPGKRKPRPSELIKLGKSITIKPRVSIARTESTLIESVPPEFAQPESGSEYDPGNSKAPSQSSSSSSSSGDPPAPTPRSSEEQTQSESDETDSDEDEDEEVRKDGPSSRTRSQSFSQGKAKHKPIWGDMTPAKVKPLDLTGQVSTLLPRDEEGEEEEGPVPTSSPSLGGGGARSPVPASPESPTKHRKAARPPSQSPVRSSQQPASPIDKPASQSQNNPPPQEEAVTQETILEPEVESAPAWPNDAQNEEAAEQDEPPTLGDHDQSLVHAMEIDELLAGDLSHHQEEDIGPVVPDSLNTLDASVIDLSNTTMDASQSVLILDPDQSLVDRSMEFVEPTEPDYAIPSQPETQLQTLPSSVPQPLEANVLVPSTYVPPSLSGSSRPQQLLDSQPPLGSQDILSQPQAESQVQQSQSQAPSQPPAQEITHSSIEEPSSWSFPPPGQIPPPADTISSFTPTNPSTRAPRTSGEHLPSSNPFPSSTNGHVYGPEVPHTQTSTGSGPHNSSLGPVPELGTEIFRRERSPGSDIGQFDSPPKTRPLLSQDGPAASPESRRNQHGALGLDFGVTPPRRIDSRGQSEKEREMIEALKEAEVKLAARDHRIVELVEERDKIAADNARALANYEDNMLQSESIIRRQQESHAMELADHAKTIADLQLQLAAVQSQYEIAEAQRAASYEQYMVVSNGAKPLADENKQLKARVQVLEKQVAEGLRQWQRGFELNMEQKARELKQLQAQLDLEREIRSRTDGREVRRRAAEWYELKKRVEDLEVENLEVEREANAARNRERELRLREQELERRLVALEPLAVQPSQPTVYLSQSQGDRGLSQDDMQTETMLSDRSAVLADLDGPVGDDMVWMCTYRDASDKLCGQAFDTMGLLMSHVLDSGGHKVDAGCQCG
ncbi:hypothetical protein RhiJN_16618 [Ceratobasidium sp. AG-Ba]|nr:hypothetical protein RhiJN_16618 [Ceratobasidium sp. AG-Ba]